MFVLTMAVAFWATVAIKFVKENRISVRSFVRSFVRSRVGACVGACVRACVRAFVRSFVCCFVRSFRVGSVISVLTSVRVCLVVSS